MTSKILWAVMIVLAIVIGFYPALYFILDRNFGLLSSKEPAILDSLIWNVAFYVHIILGGISLLVGWIQFNDKLRDRYVRVHRNIGKVYLFSATLSAISGFYVALYATGGIIAKAGFTGLSLVWLYSTVQGYRSIVNGKLIQHQILMIYSYAACLAAVTLRIWLPLLAMAFQSFIPAYRVVAWLCWVPNLVVAYFIVRKKKLIQSTI